MASLATPRSIRHDIEESHVATRRRRRAKGVPGDAKLVYDITLKSFERAKEGWQLDGDQKLEQSRYVSGQ